MPFVLVALTILLGAAALAIDLGRVDATGTEVQDVADASALAAVSAAQFFPNADAQLGPQRAQQLASLNRAAGWPGAVAAGDVSPIWYSQSAGTSTPAAWSNPVNAVVITARATPRYVLAGAFGLTPPAVTRRATAWIGNMQGAACVRPIAVPYTRIYEDESGLTSHPYSSQNPPQYAPTMTQAQIAQYSQVQSTLRTFVTVPPWDDGSVVDTAGGPHPNSGSWHTADYAGRMDWGLYQQYMAAPPNSPLCAAAKTSVGQYLTPFVWHLQDSTMILSYNQAAFLTLCNQNGGGGATQRLATCYNADGSVGVSTRVAFTDSIPAPNGHFSQRVRMVSQLRIMCYFVNTTDRCPATQVSNGMGGYNSWSMPWACQPNAGGGGCTWGPVDSGYPRGTMVVLLDGPVYGDLTPDVTLGDSLSFTQRLVLVR